jgi:endoglucanase
MLSIVANAQSTAPSPATRPAAQPAAQEGAAHASQGAVAPDAFAQIKRLGRGTNILGYDPIWSDASKGRFQEKHFKLLAQAGFNHVRVDLQAFAFMDRNNQLSPAWFNRLDWVVKHARANGLAVIIDQHNFVEMGNEGAALYPKLVAFWKQVAPHLKDASSDVFFEILNEPNGKVTPEIWNQYLVECLGIIRETNPTRTVIVGPANWNAIGFLDKLQLPENDRNLIVTVHYYAPMEFTHQGAYWAKEYTKLSGITWGTEAEKQKVLEDFKVADAWGRAHRRPLFLGEFGAYDKAAMPDRVRYTAHVARTAESLGWAWSYWQFDSDFILYNIDKDHWTEPILKALIP